MIILGASIGLRAGNTSSRRLFHGLVEPNDQDMNITRHKRG
jgi:hypothetical protein